MTKNRVLTHKTKSKRPHRWHLSGLNLKACIMVKTWSIQHMLSRLQRSMQGNQTSMSKGLKLHAKWFQTIENNANKACYTFMHLRPTSQTCKGAIQCKLGSTKITMDRPHSWQNKHTSFTNVSLKHARNKGTQPKTC